MVSSILCPGSSIDFYFGIIPIFVRFRLEPTLQRVPCTSSFVSTNFQRTYLSTRVTSLIPLVGVWAWEDQKLGSLTTQRVSVHPPAFADDKVLEVRE